MFAAKLPMLCLLALAILFSCKDKNNQNCAVIDALPDIPGWSTNRINTTYTFSPGFQYQFLNKNEGYALGATLVRSTDGGQNWGDIINFPRPLNSNLRLLSVTNNGGIFVLADSLTNAEPVPVLVRSTDAGVTWEKVIVPVWTLFYLNMRDAQNGFAFGAQININTTPVLLRTADGGASWSPVAGVSFPLVYSEYLIEWRGANVGLAQTGREQAYLTTDGGQTWTQISADLSAAAVHYLADQQTIFSIGNVTARTTNGGASWQPTDPDRIFVLSIAGQNGLGIALEAADCPDAKPGELAFATSTDGGASWERTHLLPSILFSKRQEVTPGLVTYYDVVKNAFFWFEKD